MFKKAIAVTSFTFFALLSLAAAAQLPDFTQLVEDASPAVVKINTVQKAPKAGISQRQQMPDIFRELLQQRQQQARVDRVILRYALHHLRAGQHLAVHLLGVASQVAAPALHILVDIEHRAERPINQF